MRENAEAESLDLNLPPVIPLLAGQCLRSDMRENRTQVFLLSGGAQQVRGRERDETHPRGR